MRQLSEWLVTVNNKNRIVEASFWLSYKRPPGQVHTTTLKRENKDIVVHWYGCKPSETLEESIEPIISIWLAEGLS